MKPKKNAYPAVNIGSSFMLVILIILSMVIFAVLSLSGALRDARYIERKAGRTANYYQANNAAEKILADIDRVLAETCEKAELFTEEYQTKAIDESTGSCPGIARRGNRTTDPDRVFCSYGRIRRPGNHAGCQ